MTCVTGVSFFFFFREVVILELCVVRTCRSLAQHIGWAHLMHSSKAHPMGIVPCAGLRYLMDTAGVTELKLFHFWWPGALGAAYVCNVYMVVGAQGRNAACCRAYQVLKHIDCGSGEPQMRPNRPDSRSGDHIPIWPIFGKLGIFF